MQTRYYGVGEAAETLKLSRHQVRRLVQAGELKAETIAGRAVLERKEVDELALHMQALHSLIRGDWCGGAVEAAKAARSKGRYAGNCLLVQQRVEELRKARRA